MLEAIRQINGVTDVVDAIRQVLRASVGPLTPPRIRAALPSQLCTLTPEELQAVLLRQVAAQVIYLFPKYRSGQDRYWDRPLRVHVEQLLKKMLRDRPRTRTELRRRLPAYARILADNVLDTLIAQRRVHVHPSTSSHAGPRLALAPADPRPYLRPELDALWGKLAQLGFSRPQLRDAALAILQEEVWSDAAPRPLVAAVFRERAVALPRAELLTTV